MAPDNVSAKRDYALLQWYVKTGRRRTEVISLRGSDVQLRELPGDGVKEEVPVRARQLETLWRAYINLAHSLYRSGQSAHDPAAAALDIMVHSLNPYAEPDRTPRFNLLAVPMAHAVRYLILEGDKKAEEALRKFPALRTIFSDVGTGQIKDDRDGRTSHEWLRVGPADYVIY